MLTFPELLVAYTVDPTALPSLLTAAGDLNPYYEAAKLYIRQELANGHLAEAEVTVGLAWAMTQQTNTPVYSALAHWCSAIFHFNRDIRQAATHYEAALVYYRAIADGEKEGRLLSGYALQCLYLGRLAQAEMAIQRAITLLTPLPDYHDWPILYLNLFNIQLHCGDYAKALMSARQAEESALCFAQHSPHLSQYDLIQAMAVANGGLAALLLGNFIQAEQALTQALTLAQSNGFFELIGRCTYNLGRLATLRGELMAALRFLDTADVAFAQAQIELDRATVASERAVLYERLQLLPLALQEADQAAQQFAAAGIVGESVEARLVAARLALRLQRLRQARQQLTTVQAQLGGASPLQQARWQLYTRQPLLQSQVDQYPQDLEQAQRALLDLQKLGNPAAVGEAELIVAQLETALHLPTALPRLVALMQRAQTSGLVGLEVDAGSQLARLQAPRAALLTLQRVAELVATQRHALSVEELKAQLINGSATLYAQVVALQVRLRRPAAALQSLLEAKGALWAELLAPTPATEPDPTWVRATSELNFWRAALREAADRAYAVLCQEKIVAAERVVTNAARQQNRIRPALALPTLATIQAAMPANAVAIEYLVGEKNVWACVVAQNRQPRWRRLGSVKRITKHLQNLQTLVSGLCRQPTAQLRQTLAQTTFAGQTQLVDLYNALLAPLAAHLPTTGPLIIVPDQWLFGVPWAALFDGTAAFGERYALTLLPSLALLGLELPTSPAGQASAGALLLGYAGNPPLPHIAQELAQVQASLPHARLINPASKTDLADLSHQSLLHIAAHGRLETTNPLLSHIELADGNLLLAELFQLDLHGVELVTLSACESGLAPQQGGLPLALAGTLLIAGAQRTLSSLWPVEDAATTHLMTHFYQRLSQGESHPRALQQAQAHLRNQGYRHPFYWAAFQLLGRLL